jgi:N6-L-threonylcarbamoyladenine synthase
MVRSGQRPGDQDYYDLSFSGLKTAVLMRVRELSESEELDGEIPHLAAGFQRAAIEQLTVKTVRAMEGTDVRRLVLGGGVARNRVLAQRVKERLGAERSVFIPSPRLATDNAAMVARAARFRLDLGERSGWDLNASASLPFPEGEPAASHGSKAGRGS